MRDFVLSARTESNPLPLSLQMLGVCRKYLKSGSRTASRQKAATSPRAMAPASPLSTLTIPFGWSSFSPPGRTTQYSSSAPGPDRKSSSCLFLSAMMEDMTVAKSNFIAHGASSIESPAPTVVTTEMRFTPLAFISAIIFAVPSCNIVFPTSLVLPPNATTTPVTSPVANTLATSARFVTSPCTTESFSFVSGCPADGPPEPTGTRSFAGSRTNATTLSPRPNA
mmetsp:Transcript_41566/g.69137  ORF Transcript_41566/g.69137 Transcript_41566/m.69137 type:complete len:224 (-) Transcript_41566:173-844(-)